MKTRSCALRLFLPGMVWAFAALAGSATAVPPGQGPEVPSGIVGRQLLHRALEIGMNRGSISAQARLRAELYEQQLFGSGTYHEARVRGDFLSRIEFKIPMAGGIGLFQRVNDAKFLWTHLDLPSLSGERQHRVSRVDLQRVKDESKVGPRELAGIPGLLWRLDRAFEFAPPKSGQWQQVPVWLVTGIRRDPEQATGGTVATTQGPKFVETQAVPASVAIALGQDDLFPYRLEFRRHRDTTPEGDASERGRDEDRPILVVEFYEVEFESPLHPQIFSYSPGELPVDDETDPFLEGIGK